MRIDIATLFPEMCMTVLNESIIGRARKENKIEIHCKNIRDFAQNKHNTVDDTPYGGGPGMVMEAEPIARCIESIESEQTEKPYVIFMTATGTRYTQEKCKELAKKKSIILVCGHYEGMDTRVVDEMADEEISIGDFVITGGEMAALVIADSVARLQEGVLSSPEGFTDESHFDGLLECPQYTRPEVWRGARIPEILLSGHHANIKKWRREKSLQRTKKLRPDLWKRFQK
ncbi:MAG: tRNA (guanosine(37)-N1)-methyltransferase TrmD [Oscillospiraceae bacterium]